MNVRTKKSKYLVLALVITCLVVACVAPAAYAITGVDDAVISAVIASCAMYGVQWTIQQGADALSQADIFSNVRTKLVSAGWTDSDFAQIAQGIKHPAQGIFSLGASAFRKITEFAGDLADEVSASASGKIKVGASTEYIPIGGFNIPVNGPGTYGGQAIEDACNLGVWILGQDEDKRVNGEGFYSQTVGSAWQLNCMYHGVTSQVLRYSSYTPGNGITLYCDLRTIRYITNQLGWDCDTRGGWDMNRASTTAYGSHINPATMEVQSFGKAVYVRRSVADKPLPNLQLLPDTGEINISTGLDFTDNSAFGQAMTNVVNGTGSYIPVYDYSQDIDELTTASNGILGNTTGILSGVGRLEGIGQSIKEFLQSIAGTLAQVLEAVISLARTAFDFLSALPGYLASFAGKFAGIWHYVVSWVGSLGSFITFVFGVWGNLPYAMVVPVYASAVIVLVVFVFKRFFG